MVEAAHEDAKTARFNVRLGKKQKSLIDEAAAASGKTASAFVVEAAYVEAQRVLADRRFFAIDDSAMLQFWKALERPASKRPNLRRLMTNPTTLEQE